jgi:hypothetical protein
MLAAGSEIGQGKVLFLEPDLRTAQAAAGDQGPSTAGPGSRTGVKPEIGIRAERTEPAAGDHDEVQNYL